MLRSRTFTSNLQHALVDEMYLLMKWPKKVESSQDYGKHRTICLEMGANRWKSNECDRGHAVHEAANLWGERKERADGSVHSCSSWDFCPKAKYLQIQRQKKKRTSNWAPKITWKSDWQITLALRWNIYFAWKNWFREGGYLPRREIYAWTSICNICIIYIYIIYII